jgi:hypothetical protein
MPVVDFTGGPPGSCAIDLVRLETSEQDGAGQGDSAKFGQSHVQATLYARRISAAAFRVPNRISSAAPQEVE